MTEGQGVWVAWAHGGSGPSREKKGKKSGCLWQAGKVRQLGQRTPATTSAQVKELGVLKYHCRLMFFFWIIPYFLNEGISSQPCR